MTEKKTKPLLTMVRMLDNFFSLLVSRVLRFFFWQFLGTVARRVSYAHSLAHAATATAAAVAAGVGHLCLLRRSWCFCCCCFIRTRVAINCYAQGRKSGDVDSGSDVG